MDKQTIESAGRQAILERMLGEGKFQQEDVAGNWMQAVLAPWEATKAVIDPDSMAASLLNALGVEMPAGGASASEVTPDQTTGGEVATMFPGYSAQQVLDDVLSTMSPTGAIVRGLRGAQRTGRLPGGQLRELMAAEQQLRGPATGALSDELLRSTPAHFGTYEYLPRTGEKFNPNTFRTGNIGEPEGISLFLNDPQKFRTKHSFGTAPKKYEAARQRLEKAAKPRPARLVSPYDFPESFGQARAQMTITANDLVGGLAVEREVIRDAINKPLEGNIHIPADVLPIHYERALVNRDPALLKQLEAVLDAADEASKTIRAPARQSELIDKAHDFSEKARHENRPYARVFPRFHGPPDETILKAWPGQDEDLKLFNEAYEYALRQTPEVKIKTAPRVGPEDFADLSGVDKEDAATIANQWSDKRPEDILLAFRDTGPGRRSRRKGLQKAIELATSEPVERLPKGFSELRTMLPPQSHVRREFNQNLTRYLQAHGKRGVLYTPQRYGEYELRMFDPSDVIMLDTRQPGEESVRRQFQYGGTHADVTNAWEQLGRGEPSSLGDLTYKGIDFEKVKLPASEAERLAEESKIMAKAIETMDKGRSGPPEIGRGRQLDKIPY